MIQVKPTPLERLRARLSAPGPDARLPLFLGLFALYLAIRAAGYEDYRLLLPAALLLPFDATRRWGALLGLVVEGSVMRKYLPLLANHGFLEAWVLAAIALAPGPRSRPSERAALARGLMLGLVIVVLWTGLQKALHGFYPAGEYFTAELSQPGKFAERLSWTLPSADAASLEEYRRGLRAWASTATADALSPAPPRPASLLLVSRAFCWSTLLAELGLPLLLVWRRTRLPAMVLLVGFFTGVEVAADEWHFALLVAALLALFLPEERLPWLRAAAAEAQEPGTRAPASIATAASLAALLALLGLWPPGQYALTRTAGLNPWKLGGFAMYAVPGRWDASRIETRGPGEAEWHPYDKRSAGAPRAALELEEDVLKNTPFEPFAGGATRRVEALVRGRLGDATAVRIRSRIVVYDLEAGRFRLVERVFPPPAP